jgi:hypothetical protein
MKTNTPEGEEKIGAPLTKRHTTGSSRSLTLPSIQRRQQLPKQSPADISSLPRTTSRRPNKPYTTDPSSTSNVEGDFPHERVLASLLLHPTSNALITTHSERVLTQSEDGNKPAPKSTTHLYCGTSSPLQPQHTSTSTTLGTPNLPTASQPSPRGFTNFHCTPSLKRQTHQERNPIRPKESSTKLYHSGTTPYRARHGAAEFNLNLRAMCEHNMTDCYPKVP